MGSCINAKWGELGEGDALIFFPPADVFIPETIDRIKNQKLGSRKKVWKILRTLELCQLLKRGRKWEVELVEEEVRSILEVTLDDEVETSLTL